MENKQTAVEWLFLKLYETIEMKGDGRVMDALLKQAKQMEKQQIKTAFNDGEQNVWDRQHSAFEFEFDDLVD